MSFQAPAWPAFLTTWPSEVRAKAVSVRRAPLGAPSLNTTAYWSTGVGWRSGAKWLLVKQPLRRGNNRPAQISGSRL